VLIGGGAATIYYATYAAHFVERLRVIESPLVGGTLLLALAAGFIGWAERKRSETIALLAIVLAYYTSAINPIGTFTLFSALLLSAGAVWLLVRHRWATLSFVSLFATYGSYAFWRWQSAAATGVTGAGVSLEVSLGFLLGYWVMFTAAVFLGDAATLKPSQRTPLLTANNAAFFALGAQLVVTRAPGSFWWFALGFGVMLLALSVLAVRRRGEDRSMDGAYLAQGLALVTIGLAAKLTGYQLALTLAVESAVLLTCARWRHGRLYQIAAALAAIGAFGLAQLQLETGHAYATPTAAAVALVLLFDAWWLKQQRGELAALRFSLPAALFAVLGLVLFGCLIFAEVPVPWQAAAFAAAALVCAASLYIVRLPEITLPGQLFLAHAVMHSLIRRGDESAMSVAIVAAAAVALCHWWQHQRLLAIEEIPARALQLGVAFGGVLVLVMWLSAKSAGDQWVVSASAAAMLTLVYGLATRSWPIALAGQLFTIASVQAMLLQIWGGGSHWAASLTALANLALTAGILQWLPRWRTDSKAIIVLLGDVAAVYRFAAAGLYVLWGFHFIPAEWLVPFFTGSAALLFVGGALIDGSAVARIGAAYAALGLISVLQIGRAPAWLELAGIVLVPASMRLSRRIARGEAVLSDDLRNLLTGGAVVASWWWVTRWSLSGPETGNLTIAWSVLALVVFSAASACANGSIASAASRSSRWLSATSF
jgi:hypothetical protein